MGITADAANPSRLRPKDIRCFDVARSDHAQLAAEVIHRNLEASLERHLGFPLEPFARQADVGAAAYRVVRPRRLEGELGGAAGELDRERSQLEDGELVGIADVDRTGEVLAAVHHAHDSVDDVIDVRERSSLGAVAEYRQVLAFERRHGEIGNHAAVIDRHPRSVGVEDAHDLGIDVVLPMVVHHQRFGDALALVVTRSHSDRIDVAPVTFGLRMLLRVAIDFAGRGQQDARVDPLGEAQHVDRAHHAGLDGLDRIVLVMDRRGGTRQMKNAIDLEQDRLDEIVAHQLEIAAGDQMADVGALAAEKIVQADDFVPVLEQTFTKMRPEKSCSTGYQRSHARLPPPLSILKYCVAGRSQPELRT
jgi:hypothetical protein